MRVFPRLLEDSSMRTWCANPTATMSPDWCSRCTYSLYRLVCYWYIALWIHIHRAIYQCSSSSAPYTAAAVLLCIILCSRGCAPVQQGLCTDAPGCRGCAHEVVCTQPRVLTQPLCSQPWTTVHTVLSVHALFSAAAVGIWTVHSQDCSQPFTLTSRCTHHVHTMLHRGAYFVHRSG